MVRRTTIVTVVVLILSATTAVQAAETGARLKRSLSYQIRELATKVGAVELNGAEARLKITELNSKVADLSVLLVQARFEAAMAKAVKALADHKTKKPALTAHETRAYNANTVRLEAVLAQLKVAKTILDGKIRDRSKGITSARKTIDEGYTRLLADAMAWTGLTPTE